jgi:hypothetical protein
MARTPLLSPTQVDNDVLILDGVLHGVEQAGARYGLTQPRRVLLAQTVETLIRSLREGWEAEFAQTLTTLTGRPSHRQGRDGGDPDLSPPSHQLPGGTRAH